MNWVLSVHPGVRDDIGDATDYYTTIDSDLATSFVDEAQIAFSFARQYPHAGHTVYTKYRRVTLSRFPYLMCYRVVGDTVRILAIVHSRRDPKWIRARLDARS